MPSFDPSTHKQVSFILPTELVDWLDQSAGSVGVSRKQLLIRILKDLKTLDAQVEEPGSAWNKVATSIAEAMKPTILELMEKRNAS